MRKFAPFFAHGCRGLKHYGSNYKIKIEKYENGKRRSSRNAEIRI